LTDTAAIGTRAGWENRLREAGFSLGGHRLVRRPAGDGDEGGNGELPPP
jgi:hypothetical protein